MTENQQYNYLQKKWFEDVLIIWEKNNEFCDVCLETEALDNDQLVYCDLCDGLTHQKCYGSEIYDHVHKTEFLCQRCQCYKQAFQQYISDKPLMSVEPIACNLQVKCALCPDQKGIIKKFKVEDHHMWAHVICVQWSKQFEFKDNLREELIQIQRMDPERDNYCQICQQKEGVCEKCAEENCSYRFHYTCSRYEGLMSSLGVMRDRKENPNDKDKNIPIYCPQHLYIKSRQNHKYKCKNQLIQYIYIH
ncbi:Zinc finger, FYVE/PHD-type [Pseudocohnilembus persalinus]|uniref:Zinc finger, FYVE/PHD-type n=1 Tax=Pseudocohnilembus persalinus TaxID=266149 RepID=A0A0V0QFA6_PSEPJ|nr:Zinc finger, FYVE/PHD-type [Pseudocohnilembus persalinus]|eukprot:KRX00877.1 Zinc finger, FYVE/PHD-type [Pseudocohnilembus persalinus]